MMKNRKLVIDKKMLLAIFKNRLEGLEPKNAPLCFSDVVPIVKQILIEETLVYTRGNQTQAAKIIGINRSSLREWMKRKDNYQRNRKSTL
ncbi:hypothetical protein ABHV50_004238 [Vibrio vulnificus]|nr:hypothetical protein [Vibrio vulnificus]HDU8731583.1 hypothetical protein [Vibrio vulnificus]HDU8768343.1 hypothetical protein [Vibrio vulnificus]